MRQKGVSDRFVNLLQRMRGYEHEQGQREREVQWMVQELVSRRKPLLGQLEKPKHSILSHSEWNRLENWVTQRQKGKPLQYVLGSQPFAGLSIRLRPPVLIPRWETEEWTLRLIESLQSSHSLSSTTRTKPVRILELCSGSGCISLALAHHLSFVTIDALDISKAAITLSRLNERKLGISSTRLCFHLEDIFSSNLERFRDYDIVVANPPYITPSDYATLDHSVKGYEDIRALKTSDDQGLEFYKRIVNCTWLFRNPPCRLIVEIGHQQNHLVSQLLQNHGFESIVVFKDLAGRNRCVEAVKKV